jgi:hypothetical protein
MTISPTTVSSDLTQERSSKIDNLLAQLTEKNSSTTKKSQNTLTATVTKLEKFIEIALGHLGEKTSEIEIILAVGWNSTFRSFLTESASNSNKFGIQSFQQIWGGWSQLLQLSKPTNTNL